MELQETCIINARTVKGKVYREITYTHPLEQLSEAYDKAKNDTERSVIRKQYVQMAIALNDLAGSKIWNTTF